MPPILNPAPLWQPDRSEFIILWHGCTALDKDAIEQNGIDLTVCRPNADFGRGFYTTTLERQARHWAWSRFYEWQGKSPGITGNYPVVLRFRVKRYGKKGLDKLSSLQFVLGDYDNEDYWSLVQHCRQSTAQTINDHKPPSGGWYDLVSGPVAAFWSQRVAMNGSDQISFHEKGIKVLNDLIDQGKGKGPDGRGDPDYFQWSPMP